MRLRVNGDKHIDLVGNDIYPGCFIVYTALLGRSACVRIGIVTRLETRKHRYNDHQVPTLRVIAADYSDEWLHGKPTGFMNIDLLKDGQEITLEELDRLVVVPPQSISPSVRLILEAGRKAYQEKKIEETSDAT